MSQSIEIKSHGDGTFAVFLPRSSLCAIEREQFGSDVADDVPARFYASLTADELRELVNRANMALLPSLGVCGRRFDSAVPGAPDDFCKINKDYASVHGCPDCRGCGHG